MTESAETTSPDTASSMPAWMSESHIDPSWIRQKLTGFERVAECAVEDISNDTRKGDVPSNGATLLLRLASEGEGDAEATTLVAKQVPPSGLALSRRLGLAREAIFYDRLAPKIKLSSSSTSSPSTSDTSDEACIPKIYYSHGDMISGSKVVVMEDLSKGYIDSGILFGPGNPNNWKRDLKLRTDEAYPGGAPTSFEVADRTFSAIASVHAAFWRDEGLLEEGSEWLRGAGWVRGEDEASWRASMSIIQTAWEKYTSNGEAGESEVIRWDPLVRQIVEKAMRGISWESQRERLNANSHFCLVHGDFWPGNVMISTDHKADARNADERDLRLLDWEMVGVGSGPQELGQYVISNMNPAERRECEEQLVRNYHNKIQKQVGNFAWEKCWSEYKIGGLERWLWFLVYFCGIEGMKDWAQYFHDQMKEFVHDHGIRPGDVTQPRP